jgi:hypothetical protein
MSGGLQEQWNAGVCLQEEHSAFPSMSDVIE